MSSNIIQSISFVRSAIRLAAPGRAPCAIPQTPLTRRCGCRWAIRPSTAGHNRPRARPLPSGNSEVIFAQTQGSPTFSSAQDASRERGRPNRRQPSERGPPGPQRCQLAGCTLLRTRTSEVRTNSECGSPLCRFGSRTEDGASVCHSAAVKQTPIRFLRVIANCCGKRLFVFFGTFVVRGLGLVPLSPRPLPACAGRGRRNGWHASRFRCQVSRGGRFSDASLPFKGKKIRIPASYSSFRRQNSQLAALCLFASPTRSGSHGVAGCANKYHTT